MGRKPREIHGEVSWGDGDPEQGLRQWVIATKILLRAQARLDAKRASPASEPVSPTPSHCPPPQSEQKEGGPDDQANDPRPLRETVNSILTRTDYEDYLVQLYFGSDPDPLTLCLNRAYLDFNRTLHGMGSLDSREALSGAARAALGQAIRSLQGGAGIADQDAFDAWHRATCETLAVTCRAHGYDSFYVGQAQKWINMTLKYVFTMGEERLPGFAAVYPFCHVPLDNILLQRLAPYGLTALPCAWSRLDDYECYLSCQRWIREAFSLLPLDTEFLAWMGKPLPQRETL